MTGFCYVCGASMTLATPLGDIVPRELCSQCGYIHYCNPKVQVAVLVSDGDRLLWMRRAMAPRAGFWEIPGGFMELGETMKQAAVRETFEETGVRIAPGSLQPWLVGSIEAIDEVHVIFRAEAEGATITPGSEAQAAGWFTAQEAPWAEMAFPQAEPGLRQFYGELAAGHFGMHYAEQQLQRLVFEKVF